MVLRIKRYETTLCKHGSVVIIDEVVDYTHTNTSQMS